MATAAKRQQLIAKAERLSKGVEFVLNPDKYRSDLLRALNYYSANHDDKDKKKWLIAYIAKTDKKLAVSMLKVDEYHFRYAGTLARLVEGGSTLQDKESKFLEERIKVITELVNEVKPVVAKKVAPTVAPASIQERMEEAARKHAAEFDGEIDEFVKNKSSTFSAKNYLLSNSVSAPVAKRIGEMYDRTIAELREAYLGKDKQLVEGYSNFTKRELKKFIEFVESIINDCKQQVQTAKVTRAPRKRKPVSPIKQVAKVKYMKEFADLKLKSVKPETMIGATEVWIYNTKYRKVQLYKAPGGLAVKGTTLVGFDVVESKSLTLRKPEEFFKGLAMTKRPLNAALKTIKTKASVPNGRINEECIILGAF
jgi:Asp-tRNA(Asn)/Glu-tRNA(Gln) amidotransferase C subunit